MKIRLLTIICAAIAVVYAIGCSVPPVCPIVEKPGEHQFCFEQTVAKEICIDYLIFLPQGYPESQDKWPLVLFLHGARERGEKIEKVTRHGPPKLIMQECETFPFILIVPQCPKNDVWYSDLQAELLFELLTAIIDGYPVDEERIYVTGISMGGGGTWRLAVDHPDTFAAIVPISTFGSIEHAPQLKDIPSWVFHGAKDPYVPAAHAEEMASALKKAGGNVKFTVYPDAGHDAWTITYKNPELYEWLLKQKRHKIKH